MRQLELQLLTNSLFSYFCYFSTFSIFGRHTYIFFLNQLTLRILKFVFYDYCFQILQDIFYQGFDYKLYLFFFFCLDYWFVYVCIMLLQIKGLFTQYKLKKAENITKRKLLFFKVKLTYVSVCPSPSHLVRGVTNFWYKN